MGNKRNRVLTKIPNYGMDRETKKKVDRLIHDLAYHSHCYYNLDKPVISDAEYDNLYNEFMIYKEQYPDLPDPIGSPVFTDKPVTHINKMLSLRSFNNMFDIINKWKAKIDKSHNNVNIIGEPKLDGLAIELQYQSGKLMMASTRGDGDVGENILSNVLEITHIPNTLIHTDPTSVANVYGEIYLTKKHFKLINRKRILDGNAPFVNVRNAAAGIARSSQYGPEILRLLRFYPYRVSNTAHVIHQTTARKWLKNNRFGNYSDLHQSCSSAVEMELYHNNIEKVRNDLPFVIDGIVFKVDGYGVQYELGEGSKHPNWAIAYKFPNESVVSTIDGVIYQVGRTGIVAPVACIFPVNLRGSIVSRATLHNVNKIREKDIRIGDKVEVGMMGDVTPGVVKALHNERDGNETEIVFPDTCPCCHTKLIFDGIRYTCPNTSSCQDQIIKQITYAASRKALNIKGLGIATVKLLVVNKIIKDIGDVFTLDTNQDIRNVITYALGLGQKTTNKLMQSIDEARSVSFPKFLKCLCIDNVSTGIATHIAEKFGNWDDFYTSSFLREKLSNIPNINKDTIDDIIAYLNDSERLEILDKLISNGIVIHPYKVVESNGLRVAFTGKFKRLRTELEELVTSAGGKVVSKVTKKTNYLVIGKNPKSKLKHAEKLGVFTMYENDFIDSLSDDKR